MARRFQGHQPSGKPCATVALSQTDRISMQAGWMGKSKSPGAEAAQEHVSRPLATLKDPAAFGPPPKNVNYHGGAALPNEITPHRSGLGAPLAQSTIIDANRASQSPQLQEEDHPARPPPPALPYRADRTGLKTDNLPPPPVHRDRRDGGVLPPPSRPPAPAAQPRLPPRLPSRQNTTSPVTEEPPPPSYDAVATPQPVGSSYINQSAVNRLGNAGVSVPGLGIGKQNEPNPWKDERSTSQSSGTNQLSELQSRFSRMNTPSQETGVTSPSTPAQVQSPSQSSLPSWKQSQSAFQTASNLRTNPQKVSLADAQSAAQTAGQAQRSASAFREKHADSIASAQSKAKTWDQKYKVTSKINKFLDEHSDSNPAKQQQTQQPYAQQYQNEQQYQQPVQPASAYNPAPITPHHPSTSPLPVQSPPPTELPASIARKPPPPPAPRKPVSLQAPPPVPTGTKPSFG